MVPLALFLSCAACSTQLLAADNDAPFTEEVKGVFDDGWSTKTSSLALAAGHRDKAKDLIMKDARPDLAWALVQMHVPRFPDALITVDAIVKDHPDDLIAREAQIWLHAERNEYDAMLPSMMALAVHLPKDNTGQTPTGVELDAARMLGEIFGYFAGPGAGKLVNAKLDQREKLVKNGLHPAVLGAFEQGRDRVFKKFAAISEAAGAKPATTPADNAATAPTASANGVSLTAGGNPKAAALKTKFLKDEEDLKKKVAADQAEFDKLAAEANGLQQRSAQAQSSAKSKEAEAAKNPKMAASLRAEAQRDQNDARKIQQDYDKLKSQATKLKGEITALQQKMTHLTNQYKADVAKLGPGTSTTAVAVKPAPTPSTTAKTPDAADAASSANLDEPTALDGYLTFSILTQRQHILDSLPK
jgi:hypothetical protein